MRNLFTALVDEEIKRDEFYRRTFRAPTASGGFHRQNAPLSIILPGQVGSLSAGTIETGSITTPRQANGLVPMTPGMSIGVATPGLPTALHSSHTASHLTPTAEEEVGGGESKNHLQAGSGDRASDYFSSNPNSHQSEASSESNKAPPTPSEVLPGTTPASPADDKEEKKKGLFGKNFKMTFPKNMKLGRSPTDAKPAVAAEEKQEDMSDKSSETGEKVFEDNLSGVIEKLRQEYEEHARNNSDQSLSVGITPSLPNETPVLKPPPSTMVIIQEDNPESGGVADLYRGAINTLGKDVEVVEKVAPAWLGELLLKVYFLYS